MKLISTTALALLMGAGALVTTTVGASAEIVCNHDNDCWHVKKHHDFRPEFGVVVHPDDWKWKEGEKFRWREHEGDDQGYWKGGVWLKF